MARHLADFGSQLQAKGIGCHLRDLLRPLLGQHNVVLDSDLHPDFHTGPHTNSPAAAPNESAAGLLPIPASSVGVSLADQSLFLF